MFANVVVIIAAFAEGFVEDGRVGGHALKAVVGDEFGQIAARDQGSTDVVEPETLAKILGGLKNAAAFRRRHDGSLLSQ